MPSDLFSFSVIILAVYRSICLRGGDASPPLHTIFVPFLGKLLAQVGKARYPTWASTLPHLGTFPFPLVPKISPSSSHQYLPLSYSSLLFSNYPFPFLSLHHSPSSFVLDNSYKDSMKLSRRHQEKCPTSFHQTL